MTDRPAIKTTDTEVFYGAILLKGVSPDGFKCLVDDRYGVYARNTKGIWHFHQYGAQYRTRFVTADVDGFRLLGEGYGSDTDTVFHAGHPIDSACASSFRVIDRVFASDESAVYIASTMAEGFQIWTDFDAASLQFFECGEGPSRCFVDRFQLYTFNDHFVQFTNPHHPRYSTQKQALRSRLPHAKAWWTLPDGFQNDLRPIGRNYFTNGDFVFYRFKKDKNYCCQYEHPLRDESYLILPAANGRTFKELNDFYGSDDNHVYCLNKKIMADPGTFRVLEGAFGQDKAGLWFNGFHVPQINVSNLRIKSTANSAFALDKDHLFSVKPNARLGKGKGYARLLKLEKKGDSSSFELLSTAFAKDKNQVYWHGEVWKVADPETFEVVMKNSVSEFARDRHHLYASSGKKVFKNVDGATLQILNPYWAKDENNIIYLGWTGEVMRHVDRESFEVLDNKGTAQDARKHYWVEREVVLRSRPR